MLDFLDSQPLKYQEYGTLIELNTFIRLCFFAGFLFLLGFLELIKPKRKIKVNKGERWFDNIVLFITNSLLLRIIFQLYILDLSISLLNSHWGLLNTITIPLVISVIVSIIILDVVMYLSHCGFHKFNILWRFHKVHHTDIEMDVSTGVRFHPFEAIILMLIKISIVFLLGIHPVAYVLFEILLNISLLFEHSNINIPQKLDERMRSIIVTPDMHRVHHSILIEETNSNFGFIFSLWDKLFKSYKDRPLKGHKNMTLGLNNYRDKKQLNLLNLLLFIPFKQI